MSSPGVRYERLLFWAAPITLAACAVFIAALGYNTQEERVNAKCFESAADVIVLNKSDLVSEWIKVMAEQKKAPRYRSEDLEYGRKVSIKLIYGTDISCWSLIDAKDYNLRQEPSKLIQDFILLAQELRLKPVKMYGIEIPDTATVSIIGTKIQIAMATLIQALQVALAPIILLWLGSLYHTRLREIEIYKGNNNILVAHPHVINVFPFGYYPDLRKRNFIRSKAPVIWGALFCIIRLSLISIFVAPSVFLYLGSLFYQPIFTYWSINVFSGFWVVMFSVGILVMEAQASTLHFNGPIALR
jgi:hypothetical protein